MATATKTQPKKTTISKKSAKNSHADYWKYPYTGVKTEGGKLIAKACVRHAITRWQLAQDTGTTPTRILSIFKQKEVTLPVRNWLQAVISKGPKKAKYDLAKYAK